MHATMQVASLPIELVTKLEAGATVADVGCGQGSAVCVLGERFPSSTVCGFDYHAPSIEAAIETAKRKGLTNISFAARPSNDFASDASFDVICFLDCFHDMSIARSAAKHARRVLKPEGILFLVEPMAAADESISAQLKVPGASFLSAMCARPLHACRWKPRAPLSTEPAKCRLPCCPFIVLL